MSPVLGLRLDDPSRSAAEVAEKLLRVRSLLGSRFDVIVLRGPQNVAWMSGGGRTHVELNAAVGVAAVVVGDTTIEVVTTANEADRLQEEELGGLDATWRVLPWWEDMVAHLPRGTRVATDVAYQGAAVVDLASVRRPLTAPESARYRMLGQDAARALTAAATSLRPTMSEYEASAAVAAELFGHSMDPVVLLVAGAHRRTNAHHPLPTERPLGQRVMISVCARRGGLIASLTRLVSFGVPPDAVAECYERLTAVEAAFLRASAAGATWRSVFTAGCEAYGRAGLDEHEWTRHHQGGPTGYEPREGLIHQQSEGSIVSGQALAWNPTVAALKIEDTFLVHAEGLEVITADPAWPCRSRSGLLRPEILSVA